jgi:DNA-binding NarL/FixJ family response regulator
MRKQHLLLVATAANRQVLRPLLAARAEVHVAAEVSTLPEARDVLAMLRVDVVLLQTALHGEDGFELLPAVALDTRVICLAGDTRDMMRALAYGSLECVSLPVEQRALDEALDAALGGGTVSAFAGHGFEPYHLPGQFSL